MSKSSFNLSRKQKIAADVIVGILAATLIFSLIMYSLRKTQPRMVYYFYSLDTNSICTEVRHQQHKSSRSNVDYFIEDLLLGPMTNRYQYLLNPKTTLEYCFFEDSGSVTENSESKSKKTSGGKGHKVLNVGLSSQALNETSETMKIKDGVQLLKLNIVKNFTNINKINVYIDGVCVYEE